MAFPQLNAVGDLGLGDMLGQQTKDDIDEEQRKRRLGLATSADGNPFNFGKSGVASVDLGMGGLGAIGR